MKHLKSINEYNESHQPTRTRTIGFRYSEPSIKIRIWMSANGEISEDDLKILLEHIDVMYHGGYMVSERTPEHLPRITYYDISFIVKIYNENEVIKIIEDLAELISQEMDITISGVEFKKVPMLNIRN